MGLRDIVSNALTVYRTDVSDHIAGLKKIKGEEKERAKATIEANEKVKSSLEDQIKTLGKVALGVGAVVGAVATLKAGFAAYEERTRLAAAAGAASIDQLKKASLGLRTETELLTHAAALQNGAFKLTGAQMATVERAIVAYTRHGVSATDATKKVLDAVVALKKDGLADLGTFVDTAGLSMDTASGRAKIFDRIMQSLAKTSGEVGDGQRTASEEIQAAGVKFEDSMERIKIAIGKIVAALGPLIERVAALVDEISSGIDDPRRNTGAKDVARILMFGLLAGEQANKQLAEERRTKLDKMPDTSGWNIIPLLVDPEEYNQRRRDQARYKLHNRVPIASGGGGPLESMWGDLKRELAGTSLTDPWSGAMPGGGGRATPEQLDALGRARARQILSHFVDVEAANVSRGGTLNTSLGSAAPGVDPMSLNLNAPLYRRYTEQWNERLAGHRQRESKLASMFGPLEEFNAYKMAFDTLSGAIGASMTAWIDGSKSAGEAFKAFIGEAVKGLAIQMTVEALKHGAYALGSLAFGDLRGAATHGKAAAAFAAGAVVAAGAAKALHGGGSVGAGAGAAVPIGGAGSSAPQYQGQQQVVVIGDSFGDNTPRRRAENFRRRYKEAIGGVGVVNS